MTHQIKIIRALLFYLVLLFNLSCSSTVSKMVLPELTDGKYDSEFPYKNATKELEGITESIRMLHSMAFYTSYTFDKKTKLKKDDRRLKHFKDFAVKETYFNETFSGTATVIYTQNRKALFLTCAHILDFPDTLFFYHYDVIGQPTEYISGITIKSKQNNYLPELHGKEDLEILAIDRDKDLALLSGNFSISEILHLKPFSYPIGKSKQLNWGAFVYLFGYPLNNKMITKGIVSPPDNSNSSIFYVDANINRGFSGGIVVAIRDGIPNFELVGIVRSGSGKIDYYLKPSDNRNYPLINTKIPYTEKIYVDKNFNLRYGITNVISIETVLDFFERYRSKIKNAGFNINSLFKKK